MSDASALQRRSAKSDRENIILVLPSYVKMFRTSLVVIQLCGHQFKLWDLFDLQHVLVKQVFPEYLLDCKAVQRVTWIEWRSESGIGPKQRVSPSRESPAELSHGTHGSTRARLRRPRSSKFSEIFTGEFTRT
jgi:hypothetical protein